MRIVLYKKSYNTWNITIKQTNILNSLIVFENLYIYIHKIQLNAIAKLDIYYTTKMFYLTRLQLV